MLCSAEFTASATAHTVEEPTGTLPRICTQLMSLCFRDPKFQEAASNIKQQFLIAAHVYFVFFFEGGFGHNAQVFQERNLAMWLNISAVEMCWAGTSTTILIKFEEKARESCENRGTSPIVTPLMQVMARERRSERTWGRGEEPREVFPVDKSAERSVLSPADRKFRNTLGILGMSCLSHKNCTHSSGEEISPKLEMGGSVAFFSTAVLTKCF